MLALRLFYRELKSKHFNIILLALIVAITLITTVNLYADRLNRAIYDQASELVGGDLVLQSNISFNETLEKKAENKQLKITKFIYAPTMLRVNQQLQLVTLKAVDNNYPLRGQILLKNNLEDHAIATKNIPSPDEIWLDARVMQLLNLKMGDLVFIGNQTFKFTKILVSEPDVTNNLLNIAPRALINLDQLKNTGIMQPGSRMLYTELIAGEESQVLSFEHWLKNNLTPDERLIRAKDNSNQLIPLINNAVSFLNLVIFICVILSGVAIAASSYRFYQRQQMIAALFRCFGLTQNRLLLIYFLQLFFLAIIAGLISILLAIALQYSIEMIVAHWLTLKLPLFSYKPIIQGFLSSILLLYLFALPNFINFKNISTKQLLNEEKKSPTKLSFFIYFFTALFISGFLWWATQNFKLTLIFSSSVLMTVLVLFISIQIIFYFIFNLSNPFSNAFKLGLNNIARFSINSILQILSFGLVIMLSMMIFFIKDDLLNQWIKQIPPNAPNYFVINIQKSDLNQVRLFFDQHHISDKFFYPIIRGRLTQVNKTPIQQAETGIAKQHNALRRELNLTWMMQLPNDNQVTSGTWFDQHSIGKNEISVEQTLANSLGFHLGDSLTFQIGSQSISALITSIRHVQWDSFQPNFYIIFPNNVIENFPYTWLTAVHLTVSQKILLKELIEQFPNLTIFDVDYLLSEAKRLINNLSIVIESLWLFSIIASVIIFYAVLINGLDERKQQVNILYLLGANQKFIKTMLLSEMISFGLITGVLGCVFAEISATIFAKKYFNLFLSWDISALLVSIVVTTIFVTTFGYSLLHRFVMPRQR